MKSKRVELLQKLILENSDFLNLTDAMEIIINVKGESAKIKFTHIPNKRGSNVKN